MQKVPVLSANSAHCWRGTYCVLHTFVKLLDTRTIQRSIKLNAMLLVTTIEHASGVCYKASRSLSLIVPEQRQGPGKSQKAQFGEFDGWHRLLPDVTSI